MDISINFVPFISCSVQFSDLYYIGFHKKGNSVFTPEEACRRLAKM